MACTRRNDRTTSTSTSSGASSDRWAKSDAAPSYFCPDRTFLDTARMASTYSAVF